MNQILNSEPENNYNDYNNYNNYNNNNNNNNKRIKSTDKIVRVFAFCMIIFAVGLISSGVYSYKKNQDYDEQIKTEEKTLANITAEENENEILISVSHDKKINRLVYSWNGKKENTVEGEGNTLEKTISLPAGENTLYIKVIDEENGESNFEKKFESENGVDIMNPEISLDVVNAKLVITATDETSLDFLTYRWNDEEDVIINEQNKIKNKHPSLII